MENSQLSPDDVRAKYIGERDTLWESVQEEAFKIRESKANNDQYGLLDEALYCDIITSLPFRRLKNIRFLGAIDYALVPYPNAARSNKRHNRYDHTIAVAELALIASRILGLQKTKEKYFVVAALLHDIGHAPLSHSLERAFARKFDINHHVAAFEILDGRSVLGASLHDVLARNNVDMRIIHDILNGDADEIFSNLISGPINIDTIDAIHRCYSYVSKNNIIPPPDTILLASIGRSEKDIGTLDSFWGLKDIVYKVIIKGRYGLLCDMICEFYFNIFSERFSRSDYFLDEVAFKKRHPILFDLLEDFPPRGDFSRILSFMDVHKSKIPSGITVREFVVEAKSNEMGPLWDDHGRYQQHRLISSGTMAELLKPVIDSFADDPDSHWSIGDGQLQLELSHEHGARDVPKNESIL